MKRIVVLDKARPKAGFDFCALGEHERRELNTSLALVNSQDWKLIVNEFSLPSGYPGSIELLSEGEDPPDVVICWVDGKLRIEVTNCMPHLPAAMKVLGGHRGILPGYSDLPRNQEGRAHVNLRNVKEAQEKIGSLAQPGWTNPNVETAELCCYILEQLRRKETSGAVVDLVVCNAGLWSKDGPEANAIHLAMEQFIPVGIAAVAFLFDDGRCSLFRRSTDGLRSFMTQVIE